MKCLLFGLIIAVLYDAGFAYPNKRGICLSFCGVFSGHKCPDGYECRGNGCGHECYRPLDYIAPQGCTPPSCENQSHCPVGYKVDKNGCDTCECDYSVLHSGSYSTIG